MKELTQEEAERCARKGLGLIRFPGPTTNAEARLIDIARHAAFKGGLLMAIENIQWKCDGCQKTFPVEAPPEAQLTDILKATRELLAEKGWQCGDPWDYCPECVKNGNTTSAEPNGAGSATYTQLKTGEKNG